MKRLHVLLIPLVLALMAVPALAQDSAPAPAPDDACPEIPAPDELDELEMMFMDPLAHFEQTRARVLRAAAMASDAELRARLEAEVKKLRDDAKQLPAPQQRMLDEMQGAGMPPEMLDAMREEMSSSQDVLRKAAELLAKLLDETADGQLRQAVVEGIDACITAARRAALQEMMEQMEQMDGMGPGGDWAPGGG